MVLRFLIIFNTGLEGFLRFVLDFVFILCYSFYFFRFSYVVFREVFKYFFDFRVVFSTSFLSVKRFSSWGYLFFIVLVTCFSCVYIFEFICILLFFRFLGGFRIVRVEVEFWEFLFRGRAFGII